MYAYFQKKIQKEKEQEKQRKQDELSRLEQLFEESIKTGKAPPRSILDEYLDHGIKAEDLPF